MASSYLASILPKFASAIDDRQHTTPLMVRTAVTVIWALTRLDTCLIVFAAVLLPVYYQTGDLISSFEHSLPILTICMCGFVINDLSDIEKDRVNHPGRPLPSETIGEFSASVVYFCLLAASLTMMKVFVEARHVYLYALLLIALINYNHVVAYVPVAKNVYVATVGLLPIFILTSIVGSNSIIPLIAPPLFLFMLSREILMDVQDARGDGKSLIGPNGAENVAFALKFLGSLSLSLAIVSGLDAILVGLGVSLDVVFLIAWKRDRYRRAVIHAMKLQLLMGIYFIIVRGPGATAQ